VTIDELPNRLGFSETEELRRMRLRTIVMANEEAFRELLTKYHVRAKEVVSNHQGDDFPRIQIGLSLAIGLIKRDAGEIEAYIDDLNDIIEYAARMGYTDIILLLQQARAEALESLPRKGA
jgi:hypothetical protein